MISKIILILTVGIAQMVLAEEKAKVLTDFEMTLQNDQMVFTKESVIEIHGIKYRRIEYGNNVYDLSFLERKGEISDMKCDDMKMTGSPSMIEMSSQVTSRSKIFMQALEETCKRASGGKQMGLALSPKIGISVQSKNKDSVLKNTKIYLNPLNPLNIGGAADF